MKQDNENNNGHLGGFPPGFKAIAVVGAIGVTVILNRRIRKRW